MVARLRGPRTLRGAVVWDVLRGALARCAPAASESGLHVLDAGGGTGSFAVPLAELGHQVVVVDPSPDALAALERRAAEAGVAERVRGLQGDVEGLLDVVSPGCADAVLCHGVLESVDDPRVALAGLVRTLRPGGMLSVLAANRNAVVLSRALAGHFLEASAALADPAGRWGAGDPAPRRFASGELTGLLSAAGLRVEGVSGVRVFSDLVSGALLDLEPGPSGSSGSDALLALEAAAAEHPAFREIATQLHVLASAPPESPPESPGGEDR